ncbi:lipopolysaccharide-responsive and beige-like anchor protein isoform X1 [Pteropus vampyrus]|uniref:Lipopolysaccharide-responsive and beige-like anchor protein n=2 Tax=Pteropus vampyrus TaxID=132908 RepID=A0A6P6CG52_PTEVA|nr:lipopolysaccharide-responsive and beige-like anchor protein isoform X1 [Pteropus vampyrus]XP_023385980.1 lipopolysaccharide-responsive and beige-like anchor protein isoform X1 [Pteropus vampyrus]XP_023385981.1 lipopolysaccharide-responsive and beige-like anchor protein isoform X1 [Pteropus vampyrus]XP_023385982.1 lipopolysaccharide-responsive and beige-like anchor protein isoform X1 [Pteropus vampyrus]
MASEDNNVLSPPPTGDDGGGEGKGEETSVEEGALSLKPGLPIRGIRMKFAVLTGLVEVGEVSNRDIVETVFNLLVGGQFDLEMNFIIQEGESIICMVDLLEKCDITCQAEVWSMFTAILKKSIRNLQVCTEVGLVEKVLGKIEKVDNMIADLLVDMLGVLASYNLTVRELKLFFSKLQGDKGQWPPHAGKLLSVLKHVPQKYGPDAFFNFPGKSAAAIALPPIAKWPYQNGFTFHTWLRMDPVNNINVDKDKPYLYCFRTSKGLGYSAHFVGGCLIITSIKSKGKGFQHCVKFDFKPQKWYMVTIVHIYNRWKNSELRCYVNGELASYGEITWFVNTSDTFDKCFLGSSETADANRVFCGQMTAVYLFSEALNAAQIFAIYQLGLGYKGTFKFKAESDLFLAEHHKLLLYDGKLSSAIAFTYNPRATDAQLCLESSPKDNPSIFVHSPHALMLQDVKAVLTHSIQSAMHSIGGVQVLFPLFAQLDYRQYLSDEVDLTICSTLLAFIVELLKNSIAMQEQMLACKGFLVIGYSLEKSSKSHVSKTVLELCLAFSKYLSNLQNGMPLLKHLCDHILLNPALWIHTPAKVQLTLYTYLSTEFIGTVNIYNAIRRVGTVLLIMHTLKYYYWAVNPQDRSGITPKGLDGPRPNQKEILSLRAFLLMFIKQLVMRDSGVKEDELQAILNYLLTMHEDDNLLDVLQLLVALMSEHPNSMIPAFDQRNGLRVIYKLMASTSEGIRVQALKAMGYFLKHLAPKRKAEIMLGHGLFSLLAERLMLQTNLITMTTYNVLFEILIEQICTQVIHKQHPDPDSSVKIQNPQILKVIATLLRNSPQCPESMEVRRAFLSDMIKLFNNSRENRRSLLQCSVWQEWMLSLCYFNPKNSDEQKITEMVYAIFRILLYHAVKYEWGGWRVWVDTLSITHSKVTFEMHKENLAHTFREHQRTVDEEIGRYSSSSVQAVSAVSRDVNVSVGPQESDMKNSPVPPHVTRNSDEKSSIEKTRSVDAASSIELQTPDTANEGRKTGRENQELLDEVPLEEIPTNKTLNAGDLEVSSDIETGTISSNTLKTTGKDMTVSEVTASISSPSEEDVSEVPELLDKSTVEEYDEDEYVELKVESSPTEEANLPTELRDNSLSPATTEASERLDMFSSDQKVTFQEEEPVSKKQTDTETEDSTDPGILAMTASESLATSPDTTASQTTVQLAIGQMPEEGKKTANFARETKLISDSHGNVFESPTASEQRIAKLDVSSVATDTEKLELKASTNVEASQPHQPVLETSRQQEQSGQGVAPDAVNGQRRDSRSTAFRIPEFKWSQMHQRLLTDLLFSIETDIQMWRSHSTKTVMDFVNSSDNIIFVHNTIHLISQVMDNMVMACGGILPLLSAATSATHELENIEPTQGLSIEASVTFLQRLISLVDVLIFASSLGFTEIEAEKNMSSGGILRQCLRLVCAVAVRNCLECQQHAQLKTKGDAAKGQKTVHSLIPLGKSAAKSPVDIVTGGISPVRDFDRLLQDMDINRLRAVVFRDIEDSKQAQFLALAVVYFISVLMVSKYRDILEPQNERRSQSFKESGSESVNLSLPDVENAPAAFSPSTIASVEESESTSSPARRRDSGIGEETATGLGSNDVPPSLAPPSVSVGPDAISEVLCTLSLEVNKSQETKNDGGNELDNKAAPSVPVSKNVNVKDILRSLVNIPAGGVTVDPAFLPPACLGALGDLSVEQPVQFRSFDRSVIIATKKSSALSSTLTTNMPTNAVSVVSSVESAQTPDVGGESPGSRSSSAKLPSVPEVGSVPQDQVSNMSITERLEHALEKAAPLLREIFVDFAPFLSRTLLGSHGQELLIEGTSLVCMKSSSSVVELVMLLCSQEWQNSIQKNAGLAFIELINEGRLLSQTMKDHLVRVANEAEFILSRQRAEDIHRHAEFESLCAQYSADKREDEKVCDHLIRAAKYRDHVTATQLIQKIINILTDKHGAWGNSSVSRPREFWRLDYWEDDLRRRRRFVRNPLGSTHPEATLKTAVEHGQCMNHSLPIAAAADEDILAKGKQSIKGQALGNQNSENEILLESDDDTLSSVDEKDLENLAGPVSLSTPAQLVAPSVVAKGTLSVTSSELYFEVDEEDPNFKNIDPKILAYTEGLHGKWLFTEIRSIFSRRYLLQNTALEIFMANRVAIMFNFPDPATVKKVVNYLPRVGVGTCFGLPQTRRISLASPRQLFKASNMTQRWQHREISNFEYLMFLNTIAGRSYNDLNQYPVFPWVITNYESEELDLTLPSNFRDLSKPVGALNPKRAAFFAERYESWEDDQVPKFHYGTHYSTASFVLAWLLRIEPFTTYFLNLQGGKFDHADRTFSSISRAWRNSQRDTSDVKELIPEFYYLPEMFVNFNNYNLGVMDDGTVVSDVELPPWAKTSEEFVRINRLALESEFVSCQLHQWIDLIFGYKQQGPEAVRSLNVFYYLTYEGAVNLNSITDPVLREAVEAQIRSFGQTPSQLLIEPHPPRGSAMQVSPLMFTDQAQQDVIMVLKFPSNSPVTHVAANTQPGLATPAVITVTANRLFAVNKWHNLPAHQGAVQDQPYQLPVEIDPLIASNTGMHRRQITDLLDQSIQVHSQCFVITSDNRYILVCGFWDKSFRVYSTDTGKLIQVVFGHWDVVTCLTRSESYIGGNCYILSGSRDATLLLWYWNGKTSGIGDNPGSGTTTPRAILTGHDDEITCAAVCAELGLVLSGSKEGPCLIHSMNGDLLRTLEGPENCLKPKLIQASREGHCVIFYENGFFCTFSVNGKLQAAVETDDNIRAIQLSRDGQYLLTGGDSGVVMLRQVSDLKQLFAYPGCDAGVRALALSYDQRCIIAGMASGSIVLFYNDFNRWHHEYQTRY